MKEDILNGNYNDPMVLDSYAISRVDGFGESVEKLSKALKESNVKYMKKRKDAQEDLDEDEFEGQYPKKRNYRPVEGVQEPWTGDQSFIWPDYEAEAFEKELESFRARPVSNTGYNNKALNKKMTDKYGDKAKKCIKNTLFKESKIRKPLKESENAEDLKVYEERANWYFVDEEDFPALKVISEAFGAAMAKLFHYNVDRFDQKTDKGANNNTYVSVKGYGYKGSVNLYRVYLAYDEPNQGTKENPGVTRPSILWKRQQHLAISTYDYSIEQRFEKYLNKQLHSQLDSIVQELGYSIKKVEYSRFRQYDDSNYVYMDLEPKQKLDSINNAPVEEKLQKVVDRIVKNLHAEQLAVRGDTTYWISTRGYEGSEIVFSTCLTTDNDDYYDTDDGEERNENYKKPILYLDVPNRGYCNWNSGAGYIKAAHVKTLDDILEVAEKFERYLKEVGRDVYENSNY